MEGSNGQGSPLSLAFGDLDNMQKSTKLLTVDLIYSTTCKPDISPSYTCTAEFDPSNHKKQCVYIPGTKATGLYTVNIPDVQHQMPPVQADDFGRNHPLVPALSTTDQCSRFPIAYSSEALPLSMLVAPPSIVVYKSN